MIAREDSLPPLRTLSPDRVATGRPIDWHSTGTSQLDYWARVAAADPTVGSKAPTVVRIGVTFVQGDATRQEAFTRRVNGTAVVGWHT